VWQTRTSKGNGDYYWREKSSVRAENSYWATTTWTAIIIWLRNMQKERTKKNSSREISFFSIFRGCLHNLH